MQNWTEEQMQIVDQFLREEASAVEEKKLQSWLDSSANFAKEFKEYKAVFKSMSDVPFQEMMGHLDDIHTRKKSSTTFPLKWLSIAASLLLIVAVGWWITNNDSLDQVQSDFAITTDQISLTTASQEDEALLSKAEIAYNNGDYALSTSILNQLSERDPLNFRIQHYLGRSYYLNKEYAKAELTFSSIISNSSAVLAIISESRYWLALTYLAQEKDEESIEMLEGHLEDMRGPIKTQSSELLQRLKELN